MARALPLAPATLLLLVFLAGPILWSVYGAFTDAALSGAGAAESHFVGLDNFRHAFASSDFRNAVVLTLIFTVLSAIVGQNILGLLLALLMRAGTRAVRTAVGAVVVGAWVLPEIVTAYLWSAFLGHDGTLNTLLAHVGIGPQSWLFSSPIVAVSLANVWRGTAFSMLVYSAALSEVPAELEEAAEVDGASPMRRLWSVTIPLIRRAVATNLMLITLQTLAVFGLIYAMTKGGPGNKSQTLPVYTYEQAFSFGQLGYGTALAIVLLAVGAIFSLLYLRMLRTEI